MRRYASIACHACPPPLVVVLVVLVMLLLLLVLRRLLLVVLALVLALLVSPLAPAVAKSVACVIVQRRLSVDSIIAVVATAIVMVAGYRSARNLSLIHISEPTRPY